jgi:hypothetical protein
MDFQSDDDIERLPLIDIPNASINNEINRLNMEIDAVEDELSNMVDKTTNIYLVRAETLNLLMKHRERLYKEFDEIKGMKKQARG